MSGFRTTALLGAIAASLIGSNALAAPCEEAAQATLQRVERAGMARRAPLILEALARDERLGCGVVSARHWTADPVVPKGCDLAALDLCVLPEGLPVARQVTKDVEPKLFLRVQAAAAKLSAAGHLTRPTKRLLQLLLLSDAIRRGG